MTIIKAFDLQHDYLKKQKFCLFPRVYLLVAVLSPNRKHAAQNSLSVTLHEWKYETKRGNKNHSYL